MKALPLFLFLIIFFVVGCVPIEDPKPSPNAPYLKLSVSPVEGKAPLTVDFKAQLYNSEVNSRAFYCVGMTWAFGDQEAITAIPGCRPYSDTTPIQVMYESKHTYKEAGTYDTSFTLGELTSNTVVVTVNVDGNDCVRDTDCVIGGCSGTICQGKDSEPIVTTCEWKEEYACYKLSNCLCVSGLCRWEKTAEFLNCFGDTEESTCVLAGGTWNTFSNGCVDSCDLERNPESILCTQTITDGCDCGPDRCWNGQSCETN